MKISEVDLRSWVNPNVSRDKLADLLTMAGIEVESISAAAEKFSGVIIAEVKNISQHPEADKLKICEVDTGKETLQIVCGASNVKTGMKVPLATVNAILHPNIKIKKAKLRGVESFGMLCSAKEIGLSIESEGLLELPQNAPLGEDVFGYFKLDDAIWDLSITPNRGDCLSVKGVAREVSALTGSRILINSPEKIPATVPDVFDVRVNETAICPRYIGRIIKNVKLENHTPIWMKESLRRSGSRSINVIVDIVNYVMLQLGQPMHAFDLEKITQKIIVRLANENEEIKLLDGSTRKLNKETLVIADEAQALAVAGIMGGESSRVTAGTRDIFLESAFFNPSAIAKQREYYGLTSDSSYRYERGVDPNLQVDAIEYATKLILEIAGGEAGPLIEKTHFETLPTSKKIGLTPAKLEKILGVKVSDAEVDSIFKSLNFSVENNSEGWKVVVPAYRFDVSIPEDLVEEVARIYGFNNIPATILQANLQTLLVKDEEKNYNALRSGFCYLGFQEIISYSFVDKNLQKLFDPDGFTVELLNPISSDMSVMRSNLLSGLIKTFQFNFARQQNRIRIFEIGGCFLKSGATTIQTTKCAGLIYGLNQPEQWGIKAKTSDFYDLKGYIENLFGNLTLSFSPEKYAMLHPGQSASIFYGTEAEDKLGYIGKIHPKIARELSLPNDIFIFEIELDKFRNHEIVKNMEISKFPEIRRDLAFILDEAVPASKIQDTIKVLAGDWLKDVFIFDVYQGKGISPGQKSIAIGLILQHPTRTLVDDEVAELIGRIIETLTGQLGAELRS